MSNQPYQPLEKVEPNPLAVLENESYQPLEKVEPNPLAILENQSSENLRSEEEAEEEAKDLAPPFSKVDSEEESKDLAPPFPKVVSKVVKKAVERLSVKYNFEVEEALLYLSQPCQPLKKVEPKVKSESLKKVEPKVKNQPLKKVEPKVKSESLKKVEPNFCTTFPKSGKVEPKIEKLKAKYPMPFDGIKREDCCSGLVKNHGLYTQCSKKVKGLCKSCEKQPYGNIDDRVKVGLYEYKDPKGKSPKRYTEVLKALKVSKEEVEEEAKRLNVVISAEHLEEVFVENVKRGRPKAEKKVKEATGKKGRPKKETKKVEVNDDEEEDLFATLIANAQPFPPFPPLEKVEPNPMPLEGCLDVIVEEAKDVIVEDAKDLAPPFSKVEKVDKKQKKAEEKAAKEAAKEAEKQKKAEEKAAKEAEKESKKKSKDLAPPLSKVEKSKDLAPPLSKVEKSKDLAPPFSKVEKVEKVDNEEADVVNKLEFEGKSYYKSKKSGVIYNMDEEVVGKWNEERKGIDFEEEEEEEEEYDD